eukprot:gnl/TRDRNA2_/TRDRNA2_39067_c0_seq1.p1 gnl/TRDRNA2_/TRDRNA2_39067_c0~~gnl/TRDRNA2_/TRDRNA2_39067_c0_seq1.p1  ORF type:complete len:447 (-),score=83.24 gnl/TRDRNA2_/TRDRNA2_39067_c0_seq1:58-1398(-)
MAKAEMAEVDEPGSRDDSHVSKELKVKLEARRAGIEEHVATPRVFTDPRAARRSGDSSAPSSSISSELAEKLASRRRLTPGDDCLREEASPSSSSAVPTSPSATSPVHQVPELSAVDTPADGAFPELSAVDTPADDAFPELSAADTPADDTIQEAAEDVAGKKDPDLEQDADGSDREGGAAADADDEEKEVAQGETADCDEWDGVEGDQAKGQIFEFDELVATERKYLVQIGQEMRREVSSLDAQPPAPCRLCQCEGFLADDSVMSPFREEAFVCKRCGYHQREHGLAEHIKLVDLRCIARKMAWYQEVKRRGDRPIDEEKLRALRRLPREAITWSWKECDVWFERGIRPRCSVDKDRPPDTRHWITAVDWRVVGGRRNGGIVVKSQQQRTSEEVGRLQKGAIVKGIRTSSGRIHYMMVSGSGPEYGWVSQSMGGRELLRRVDPTQ